MSLDFNQKRKNIFYSGQFSNLNFFLSSPLLHIHIIHCTHFYKCIIPKILKYADGALNYLYLLHSLKYN